MAETGIFFPWISYGDLSIVDLQVVGAEVSSMYNALTQDERQRISREICKPIPITPFQDSYHDKVDFQ